MPGNPLTDPNWARDLADTVERLVETIREKTTKPIVTITRALVFGLLIGIVAIVVVTLLLIATTRAVQTALDAALPHGRAVYLSYLTVGGIICVAGALLLRKRFTEH